MSIETICYLSILTVFFNAWAARVLDKGGEIFKGCKVQYSGLRQLDKVYSTLIASSKETKHNSPLLLNPLLRYNQEFEMTIHIPFAGSLKFTSYGKRALDNITTNFERSIDVLSTDRHLSKKKLMRTGIEYYQRIVEKKLWKQLQKKVNLVFIIIN